MKCCFTVHLVYRHWLSLWYRRSYRGSLFQFSGRQVRRDTDKHGEEGDKKQIPIFFHEVHRLIPRSIRKHFRLDNKVHDSNRYSIREGKFTTAILCRRFLPLTAIYSKASFGWCQISLDCECDDITWLEDGWIDLDTILIDFYIQTHRSDGSR